MFSYFSLNNERKVSELIPLVDSSTIFQIQPSWSCLPKVQTLEGHLLPRDLLGSNTSEPVTSQQRRKGKNLCNTGGSSGSHPSQSIHPSCHLLEWWGLSHNLGPTLECKQGVYQQKVNTEAIAHVFSCFVFTHLVNKHLGAPMYL